MEEKISVIPLKNIKEKDLYLANKIFSDRTRVNKKNTFNDIANLTKEFNDYMFQSWWKVKFELQKEVNLTKTKLNSLKIDILSPKTNPKVDSTRVVKDKHLLNTNIVTIKEKNIASEPQNMEDIKLSEQEQQYLQEMILLKWLNSEQSMHLGYCAKAMKANNIQLSIPRLKAMIALWDQETWMQVDSKKSLAEIKEIINEIKSKIDKIKYLLNDEWDIYFDKKLLELEKMTRNWWKFISQYNLYLWTQGTVNDYTKNVWGIKTAIDEINLWFKSIAFETALATTKYKKKSNESNSQFVVRLISSKPSSFGKYEINPDILASRIINSWNISWNISKKLFPNWKFNRDGLIKSMQNQTWWMLNQLELEYIYQKYFFADNLKLFNGDPKHDKDIIKFMGIDHNAWEFASRNWAIQSALNKILWSNLKIDWDITIYDDKWRPLMQWDTYEQIKKYASNSGFSDVDLFRFVSLSKSKDLETTNIYQALMRWKPKFVELTWNIYGRQIQLKYV